MGRAGATTPRATRLSRPRARAVGAATALNYYATIYYYCILLARRYTHASGSVYDGQWRNGLKEGRGAMEWAQSSTFYHVAAGDRYVGQWKHDVFDGSGVLTSADGSRRAGKWESNHLVEDVDADAKIDRIEAAGDFVEDAAVQAAKAVKEAPSTLNRRVGSWLKRRAERRRAAKEADKKAAAEVDAAFEADVEADAKPDDARPGQENQDENHPAPAPAPAPAPT